MDKKEYKEMIKGLYDEIFLQDLSKEAREKLLNDKKWDRELDKEYVKDEMFYRKLKPLLRF